MAGGIFVSYRRDDAKHAAGRLVDRLGRAFSSDQLFLDIDNIEPGLDFKRVLSEKVAACDVLLAVIGPGWLDSKDAGGARRLDNPKDFVRIEIEAALARDVRVIPVLVDGARMPSEEELPEPLQPLALRNAVRLTHERFASDADDLTKALAKALGSPSDNEPPALKARPQTINSWGRRGGLMACALAGLVVGFFVPAFLGQSSNSIDRRVVMGLLAFVVGGGSFFAFNRWRDVDAVRFFSSGAIVGAGLCALRALLI